MKISTAGIEVLLAERGMTKGALASASNLSRQSVSVILARGTCSTQTAGKLAAGLGVKVSDIVMEAI